MTEDELPKEEDLPEPPNEEEIDTDTVDSVFTWTAVYIGFFYNQDCMKLESLQNIQLSLFPNWLK